MSDIKLPSTLSDEGSTRTSFNPGTLIGPAIDAGVSIWQSYQQKKENQKNREREDYWNERSFEYQSDEAEKSYKRQKELYDYMFNKENDYNSPRHQMQRLKEAGLNPALLAGSAIDSGGSAVSMPNAPQATAPSAASTPMQSPYSNFTSNLSQLGAVLSQIGLNKSQRSNLDKDTEKKSKDIELTDAETEKVKTETKELVFNIEKLLPQQAKLQLAELQKIMTDIDNSTQITQAQCNEIKHRIDNIIAETSLKRGEKKKLDIELKEYDKFIQDKYKEQRYRADMTKEEYEYYDSTKALRTRIMQAIHDPGADVNQLVLDFVMYFLTQWMH